MAFNLFKLKGPKKTEDRVKISYDIAHLPAFKYFGNAKSVFKENIDGKKCLCCGKISKYIYTGPFYYKPQNNIVPFETVDEWTLLCPDCIKNGAAAKHFTGEFTPIDNIEPCDNIDCVREIAYKTPSYNSFQEATWLSCCGEPCEFVGDLAWWDVEALGIVDEVAEAIKQNEVFIDVGRPLGELIDAVNCSCVGLYVFRCLHCGKYRVDIQLD